MNLLPCPRVFKIHPGRFILPRHATLWLDPTLNPQEVRSIATRLHGMAEIISTTKKQGNKAGGPFRSFVPSLLDSNAPSERRASITAVRSDAAPNHPEGYLLTIARGGVSIEFREIGGLRAAVATLRQLWREHGRRLPCAAICDRPDFPRRGVMLDVSRGRVPKLATLLELVDQLADFKINEFQLYFEHTFAYRRHKNVWRDWGALTARDIRTLDARCRELGIDLVPNQNSFGHLREWLARPPLNRLAEVAEPYEDESGEFRRHPSTLAPAHPGTLPFLRRLYDELLPNFSSQRFNVGCDETWDLGRGQSKALCAAKGRGRVYLDFLKAIQREVSRRGRCMMFWGDIVLKYPGLIGELASFGVPPSGGSRARPPEGGTPNLIALNWGYESNHPFEREAARFARSGIPFYVCPGTSTWMTLIGRHDNAFANLRCAARAGRRHGAVGFLVTDWGDGGHPQPLAVSYLPYLAGAALSWNSRTFDEQSLAPVLGRDIFHDSSRRLARAAMALGLAHGKLKYYEANATPLGTVIAAPPPEWRELYCRNGLEHYGRIPEKAVRATLAEVERQRDMIRRSQPNTATGRILALELDLAARMAAQSCRFMLWQQAMAAGKAVRARQLAKRGIRELRQVEKDFDAYWPRRNKGTPKKCSVFLRWRSDDYRRGIVPAVRRP